MGREVGGVVDQAKRRGLRDEVVGQGAEVAGHMGLDGQIVEALKFVAASRGVDHREDIRVIGAFQDGQITGGERSIKAVPVIDFVTP